MTRAADRAAPVETFVATTDLDVDDSDAREEFVAAVTRNVDFQLSYRRSPEKRRFTQMGMTGPRIDDAFSEGQSVGHWDSDDMTYGDLTREEVQARCFGMALNEAVHEALEWFQIDGRPALNPHGYHEGAIFEAVGEMVEKLWNLRYHQPSHSFCLRVTGRDDEPTHIRSLPPDGMRPTGRIDGSTLCGKTLERGWDLEGVVSPEAVRAGDLGEETPDHNPLCTECTADYLAQPAVSAPDGATG